MTAQCGLPTEAVACLRSLGGRLWGITGRSVSRTPNREMFEEGDEVLFKAFEGKPFSRKGKYYTIRRRYRIAATR
jgi:hypothetical protein